MKTSLRVLSAVLLLSLAGCPKRVPSSSTESLDEAAQSAQAPEATARSLALAGFQAYLVGGDAKTAQARFDAALVKDASEPYALYGQLVMARRRALPGRALRLALDLCERAPSHPLSTAGARYVLDITGTAVPLDDEILARAPKALAAGAAGDAAHLLRSAVASIRGARGEEQLHLQANAELAVAERYTLIGPFSPFQLLSFDDLTPPEQD
ncbi:MAG TPA: hypothetical protein VK447_02700, partial [Myxococcaceae bacterium]|nr:hypothetical protein [Myxococcaceae bacterium]